MTVVSASGAVPAQRPVRLAPGSGPCALAWALAAVAGALVICGGSLDFLGVEPLGLTFNSMLSHLLQGRWDVDPAAIGAEAFVRGGRSYAYFGPLPALLRLPLVLVPGWRTLHVERLSCWIALMLGAAAQFGAVSAALEHASQATRRALLPPLVLCCVLGGPAAAIGWKGALIYHEAILWAWAPAMLFVMLALRTLMDGTAFATPRLCAMAGCAGASLMARSTTGAGLFAALGLLLLRELLRGGRDGLWRRLRGWPLWAPSLILAGFMVAAGVVNQARWGNLFCFADLDAQVFQVAAYPDRPARMAQYGLFNPRRLGVGVLYYFAPAWSSWADSLMPMGGRIARLFDAVELPASSLVLSTPLWCVLSAWGAAALVRGRAPAGAWALVAGCCLAPALMLVAWYMAFRYRVEFTPLLLALSCLGLRARGAGLDGAGGRTLRSLVLALCGLQVATNVGGGLVYRVSPFGPSAGYEGISLLGGGGREGRVEAPPRSPPKAAPLERIP